MAKPSCIIEKANSFANRRRLCIIDYRGLRMDGSGAKRERNGTDYLLSIEVSYTLHYSIYRGI